jgi:hypothetical protein
MNNEGRKPFVVIDAPAAACTNRLKEALSSAGWFVIQSFDLQNTSTMHEGCTCSYHGTSRCTCEFIVLLAYPDSGEPVTISLDGRDGQTQVSVLTDTGNNCHSQEAESMLRAVLEAISTMQNQETFTQVNKSLAI